MTTIDEAAGPQPLRSQSCQWLAATGLVLLAGPVAAASLTLQVSLPVIDTSPYYRPYLAAWIERSDDKAWMNTLSVWYDMRLRDGQGKGWLRHLRTWWRGGGEQLTLPADGVSGPTRPAGMHTLHFTDRDALANLPKGRYQLAVEVVREQGERELLRVPFDWGGPAAATTVHGSKEIDKINISMLP